MTKTALLATAAVLALGVAGAASASVSKTPTVSIHTTFGAQKHNTSPKKKGGVLYNQNSNDSGEGVDSQVFESTYASYDDEGADDFTIKTGTWTVTEVDVTGQFYNGSGPASSEDVTFYEDAKGLPGKTVKALTNLNGTANGGSFDIPLGKGVKLKKGTYWVSVQANCPFSGCGQWAWEINSKQFGNAAEWQNPGGGFAICPTWGTIENCTGEGPDFMFELLGKAKK